MQADAYVVANGVGAQALCRQAGLQPLIYPLKGYSLTYALGPDSSAPRTSLSDVHNKVVYARLGDRLRVAGMVDIGDRDAGIDGGRIHLAGESSMAPRRARLHAGRGQRRRAGRPHRRTAVAHIRYAFPVVAASSTTNDTRGTTKQTRRLRQGAGALLLAWRRRWRRPRKVRRERSRP